MPKSPYERIQVGGDKSSHDWCSSPRIVSESQVNSMVFISVLSIPGRSNSLVQLQWYVHILEPLTVTKVT
jgi:hypothetical protein